MWETYIVPFPSLPSLFLINELKVEPMGNGFPPSKREKPHGFIDHFIPPLACHMEHVSTGVEHPFSIIRYKYKAYTIKVVEWRANKPAFVRTLLSCCHVQDFLFYKTNKSLSYFPLGYT